MLLVVRTASQSCFNHVNKSYNTNSPSSSMLTVVCNIICTHVRVPQILAMARAAFIPARASDCVATIQVWCLFKEIW